MVRVVVTVGAVVMTVFLVVVLGPHYEPGGLDPLGSWSRP